MRVTDKSGSLEERVRDEGFAIVPRGGILAMRQLIVHASSKSQSNAPRRVLHVEYTVSSAIADGLELAIR